MLTDPRTREIGVNSCTFCTVPKNKQLVGDERLHRPNLWSVSAAKSGTFALFGYLCVCCCHPIYSGRQTTPYFVMYVRVNQPGLRQEEGRSSTHDELCFVCLYPVFLGACLNCFIEKWLIARAIQYKNMAKLAVCHSTQGKSSGITLPISEGSKCSE